MDRRVFSKAVETAGDRRHRARSVLDGPRSVQSELMGDPGDLVKRALGILAEDHMKGNETRPTDLKLQRPVLSDGTECPLPIRYFDVQCLVASFLTDLDRAAELLKADRPAAVGLLFSADILAWRGVYQNLRQDPRQQASGGLSANPRATHAPVPEREAAPAASSLSSSLRPRNHRHCQTFPRHADRVLFHAGAASQGRTHHPGFWTTRRALPGSRRSAPGSTSETRSCTRSSAPRIEKPPMQRRTRSCDGWRNSTFWIRCYGTR